MWVWNSNQVVEAFVGFGAKSRHGRVLRRRQPPGRRWPACRSSPRPPATDGYAHGTTIDFGGVQAKYVKLTINSNWGTLKQYGLSEVRFLLRPGPGQTARARRRRNRRQRRHRVELAARPRGDLAQGVSGQQSRRRGRWVRSSAATVTEHSYTPASLDFGTTYFWKVDEVGDAATYPGEVWSFTTQEYAAIDDFESYTDDEGSRIYQSWIDGLTTPGQRLDGRLYRAPRSPRRRIVHGGGQSMPFEYNNVSTPFYSEAERTFDTPQDWTTNGADTLSLYCRGNPTAFLREGRRLDRHRRRRRGHLDQCRSVPFRLQAAQRRRLDRRPRRQHGRGQRLDQGRRDDPRDARCGLPARQRGGDAEQRGFLPEPVRHGWGQRAGQPDRPGSPLLGQADADGQHVHGPAFGRRRRPGRTSRPIPPPRP